MDEFLRQSVPLAIAIFLVTAMLSLGLDLTLKQIMEPLRNRRLVIKSVLISGLAVPLVAIALTQALAMEQALATGLIVYALAAGTEGGPKFVQLVMAINLAIPGAEVSVGEVVVKLLLLVALPIAVGMVVNARVADLAARISPGVHRLSMIFLAILFFLVIYVNIDAIVSLQWTALLAGLLLFAISYVIGYAAGGPAVEDRKALAFMTFARNGSISMLIAGQVFIEQPQVLVMATLMAAGSVVVAVIVVVTDRLLNRRTGVATAI
jgi:BASS family bile acid:Na+ symporter